MILNLFAYFIIPAYTVFFVKGYGWFTTNFSVIGNYLHRKDAFVLWGLLVGCYFFYSLRAIIRLMKEKPKGTFLVPLSLVLLFCAITTPYLPEELPLKAFLHIIFAFMAAVLLLLCLFLIIRQEYRQAPSRYKACLFAWAGIVAGSAFLLILVGIVSSALEIYFTITSVILTRRLLAKLTENSRSVS